MITKYSYICTRPADASPDVHQAEQIHNDWPMAHVSCLDAALYANRVP